MSKISLTSLLQMSAGRLVVSGCLVGLPCRYDGQSKPHKMIRQLAEEGLAIPVCPEQLGGLSTPRPPSGIKALTSVSDTGSDMVTPCAGDEVWQGKTTLINRHGDDVTEAYKRGAELALARARELGITCAVLKQHSPSCGCGSTGGAEPWQRVAGDGVTTSLFKSSGLTVISDEQLEEL